MEKVLCIKKDYLLKILNDPLPQGAFLKPDISELYKLPYTFLSRDLAENNTDYKQIIPYQIIKFKNKFFVYERKFNQGEKRLLNLLSIGVGGHINESDTSTNHHDLEDILKSSILRERREELCGLNIESERFLGWINDDSQPVGQVHLGLVFLVEISSSDGLDVKEVDKLRFVGWWGVDKIRENAERFESWSIKALSLL